MKERNKNQITGNPQKSRWVLFWVLRVVLIIFFLLILISVLFHVPFVQNKVVDITTDQLSKKWNTEVSIESVDFSIFKGLQLHKFYIEDLQKDTLIFAEKFNISLKSSLVSILKSQLDLSSVSLENSLIRLKNNVVKGESNFTQIFGNDLGIKKDNSDNHSNFKIDLDHIHLSNNRIEILNLKTDERISIELDLANINFRHIDINEKILELGEIEISKPKIQIKRDSHTKDTFAANLEFEKTSTNLKATWKFNLDKLHIANGSFSISGEVQHLDIKDSFDSKNFELNDFNMIIDDFVHHPDSLSAFSISTLNGNLDNQIKIKSLQSDHIELLNESFTLNDFVLKTKRSELNHSSKLKFTNGFPNDMSDVWNMVSDIEIYSSKISEKELLYFVPSLRNAPIFKNNSIGHINLEGKIKGRTRNIRAHDIAIYLGKNTYFKGDVFTRNLDRKNQELINLGIDELATTVKELRTIIPGFDPPENFDKLGKINFSGRIDGFFKDFVSFGNVNSDLGVAEVDMRLDVKNGINNAKYSGKLRLEEFDIKSWSDNPDFGIVSLNATIDEGVGLTKENARAKLIGQLELFEFKGYQYRNADLTGSLNQDQFNGSFSIRDENIDLDFNGLFEFKDEIPNYRFNSDIRKLDLMAMNLSKDPWDFSGILDINLNGRNLDRAEGLIQIDSLKIKKNGKLFNLQRVEINSRQIADGMLFSLDTDFADFNVSGRFDLRQIPKVLVKIIKENYPYHTRNITTILDDNVINDHDFNFNLNIEDSKNIFELAGIKDLRFQQTEISGRVIGEKDQFDIDFNTPIFVFNKIQILNLSANAKNIGQDGKLDIKADTFLYDSNVFEPIEIALQSDSDDISFLIKSENNTSTDDELSLKGKFIPHQKGYQVSIDENELTMLSEKWKFNPKNKIVFGKNYIQLEDFDITDDHRQISIRDIENSGLDIKIFNFNLDLANPIIDYDKMLFSGSSVIEAKIHDIFGKPKINGRVDIGDFRINDDQWGTLNITASQQSESIVEINVLIQNNTEKFAVAGYYDLDKKYLESFVKIDKFPLDIFEYIIPDGISNTVGVADIEARINGSINDLKLEGDGIILGGSTKVDYLGCTYGMDQQHIVLTDKYIDLSEITLTDVLGNKATMAGGLNHSFFTDFLLDVDMSSDKFVILNTTKVDNPLYYGFGQGKMSVTFRGPFSSPDIDVVNAITGPDTKITFPISSTQSDYDKSFIKFVSTKKETKTVEDEFKIEGVDFEMNLEITEAAEMKLIFDEQVGEILEGNGRGNVQIFIKRNGEFDVFGNYDISEGEYLFTAYGLIAKPFKIERGGSLSWSGDPFDANLDITANYTGVRAPLNVFLAEYLEAVPAAVRDEANNRTDVNLQMLLGGTLYKPDINFDIYFQDVSPALRSYTDSKMQLLRATDNGINNQVVGLLIFKSFLPVNNPLSSISGNSLLATGSSTLTEFFTSQLGLILGDALQSQLGEDFFIQDIDVEIGLNENTSLFDEGTDSDILPDELDLNLRNTLKNNMVLSIGGNYVWENNYGNATNYLVGDFSIKYPLTKDRRLNIKLYGKLDYDEVLSRRKVKYGSGISYRLEFENLSKYEQQMKMKHELKIKEAGSK